MNQTPFTYDAALQKSIEDNLLNPDKGEAMAARFMATSVVTTLTNFIQDEENRDPSVANSAALGEIILSTFCLIFAAIGPSGQVDDYIGDLATVIGSKFTRYYARALLTRALVVQGKPVPPDSILNPLAEQFLIQAALRGITDTLKNQGAAGPPGSKAGGAK